MAPFGLGKKREMAESEGEGKMYRVWVWRKRKKLLPLHFRLVQERCGLQACAFCSVFVRLQYEKDDRLLSSLHLTTSSVFALNTRKGLVPSPSSPLAVFHPEVNGRVLLPVCAVVIIIFLSLMRSAASPELLTDSSTELYLESNSITFLDSRLKKNCQS
ncbi:hypothetical protein Baya_14833 [Bagarius yarrelli]|uniref:Uncharacterized protein n=1 Tax=Bagarius yarrelli TaxID=175774 RepID=A0A556VA81_BAGYA|nr:hypothetical protein Baya_14833 [Bagarius yarrelli]